MRPQKRQGRVSQRVRRKTCYENEGRESVLRQWLIASNATKI